jgi:hypothetical protein
MPRNRAASLGKVRGAAAASFDKVRKAASSLPSVTEATSWGAPALKVRGRMFACLPTHKSAEPNSLVVRLQFVDRDWLRQSKPDVYYLKPHYVDYPCVLVRLAKITRKDLRELLEISREFVAGTSSKGKRVASRAK